jgi:diaminopimelate epimerase
LHLTKHHGLGNDFLVVLDETNAVRPVVDGDLARRLCDRRTGIGADGLIHGAIAEGHADRGVIMHLFNADGSRAEMSGNGVRCLAQAVAIARDDRSLHLLVETDAGARPTVVDGRDSLQQAWVTADMGPARPGPEVPETVRKRLDGRFGSVDMGNPHLVVEVPDPAEVDLVAEGGWIEAQFDGGVNVEFVAAAGRDALVMTVWERGAGVTQACGTGACASAHLSHEWGLVDDDVEVRMPGGAAAVTLGDTITLAGSVSHIATIEVEHG